MNRKNCLMLAIFVLIFLFSAPVNFCSYYYDERSEDKAPYPISKIYAAPDPHTP